MAAATKICGKLNELCYASIAAVPGVSAYLGRVRMLDSTNFEGQVRAQNTETQCYAITWVSQSVRVPIQSGEGSVELTVLLFFKFDKDESSDSNSMYDKVDQIGEALTPDGVWSSLGAKLNRITVNRVENRLQDDIAEWRMTISLDVPFC